jgi:hypothetical protein
LIDGFLIAMHCHKQLRTSFVCSATASKDEEAAPADKLVMEIRVVQFFFLGARVR